MDAVQVDRAPVRAFAEAWHEAWHAADTDALAALCTPDVSFATPFGGSLLGDRQVYDGIEELSRYWSVRRFLFDSVDFVIAQVHLGGDVLIIEYEVSNGSRAQEILFMGDRGRVRWARGIYPSGTLVPHDDQAALRATGRSDPA